MLSYIIRHDFRKGYSQTVIKFILTEMPGPSSGWVSAGDREQWREEDLLLKGFEAERY